MGYTKNTRLARISKGISYLQIMSSIKNLDEIVRNYLGQEFVLFA
jgi:hypothetical protein